MVGAMTCHSCGSLSQHYWFGDLCGRCFTSVKALVARITKKESV